MANAFKSWCDIIRVGAIARTAREPTCVRVCVLSERVYMSDTHQRVSFQLSGIEQRHTHDAQFGYALPTQKERVEVTTASPPALTLPQPTTTPTPPPPILRRSGPTKLFVLAVLFMVSSCAFVTMVSFEVPFLVSEMAEMPQIVRYRQQYHHRQMQTRPDLTSGTDTVEVGIWDEQLLLTRTQLVVVLGLVLDVDEQYIRVELNADRMFKVLVNGNGPALKHFIDDPQFLVLLNERAYQFGSNLLIFHRPQLVRNDLTGNHSVR